MTLPRSKKAKLLLTTLLSLSTLLLLFLTTPKLAILTPPTHKHVRVLLSNANDNVNANVADTATVNRHCDGTLHRDVCVSALSAIPNLAQKSPQEVISKVVERAAAAVRASSANCTSYLRSPQRLRLRDRLALADCLELFGHTLDQLGTAATELSAGNVSAADSIAGVQTVLSAAMTNQYTCLEGFAGPSAGEDGRVRPYIQGRIYHVAHLVSNSLAMVRRLPQRRGRGLREAPFEGYGGMKHGFPTWVSARDRRRLQVVEPSGIMADVVVAKDGSGNFTTVSDAVAAAPNNSDVRYVIYIKAGGYFENVEVGSQKTNIMFVGDGMWKTIIKASRNVVDNSTTFRSATLDILPMKLGATLV